ncbi:hypothetical protein [Micromonospora chokoriensis]|uniref:Uncharacterized protein n=1 Tax=Micromonospora chokoriensis TaxID=356851 RepID=A0A1C4Z3C9_9ACTN|nr:hypothetical protein [Micromonospora chokoriensis]SCF27470.1 hypothetical protein GA0070612_5715 [Micromonospora chokoriensis]
MANERVTSVGGYFLRLLGGVLVILGLLGIFSSLPEGNLVGLILAVVFVAGGVVMLKRSGGADRARGATDTPPGTR